MPVGQSQRTLGKHILLNKLLGREVGIMARCKPPYISNQYTIMDLCAGDGRPSKESGTSSPDIITYHVKKTLKNSNINYNIIFVEKDENTFHGLKNNYSNDILLNVNARNITEPPVDIKNKSAMFIHADPNNINDWPISPSLLSNTPEYTTLLATLGCNVGGLKRLSREHRDVWFKQMDELLHWMPNRHDALLVSLCGDEAQWAYLIVGPQKWHKENPNTKSKSYKKHAQDAFKNVWHKGIECVSYRNNESKFNELRDKLFLQKGELQNA